MRKQTIVPAVLLVVTGLLSGCSADDDSSPAEAVTATAPPTTTILASDITQTSVSMATAEVNDPLVAFAYEFIAAFNSGDVDAVLGYFADSGDYVNLTATGGTPFDVSGYQDVAEIMAWAVSADTKLTSVTCALSATPGDVGVVDCTFLWDDLLRRTAGFVPLPGGMLMVAEDGVFTEFESFIALRSGSGMAEFGKWLSDEHPGDLPVASQLSWDSVADAVATGEIQTRYVDEWSAALDAVTEG